MDSGADVSVIPLTSAVPPSAATGTLVAANGSKIKTFSVKSLTLLFGTLSLSHQFLVADISKPILGSDFFAAHDLLIDVKNRQLVHFSPHHAPTLTLPSVASPLGAVAKLCALNQVEALLDEFPGVLESKFDSAAPPAHGVSHVVPTDGPPVFSRSRRLDGEKLSVAKAEFQKMLSMGIVRPSSSPWASPLHVVPKPNTGWRPCGCLLYTSDAADE